MGQSCCSHPRPAVTVDMVVFTILEDQLQILLIQRGADPYKNMWALPGGFVGDSVGLETAALRENGADSRHTRLYRYRPDAVAEVKPHPLFH